MNSARTVLRTAPLLLTILCQGMWLGVLLHAPSSADALRQIDWIAFFQTGHRLVSGDFRSLYPPTVTAGFWWLYPPHFVYVTSFLGLLSIEWAYAIWSLVYLVSVAGALVLLRLSLAASRRADFAVAPLVAGCSFFNLALILGQMSGFWVLFLAASLWSWQSGRALLTGSLLALTLTKPNLGMIFPLVLVVTSQWRVLAGLGLGLGVMGLSSLPLGIERWPEFLRTMSEYTSFVDHSILMTKQLTMYAFLRTAPGLSHCSPPALLLLWFAVALLLLVATLTTWRGCYTTTTTQLPRLFGIAVLFTVAGNFDLYSYDGLLLIIPAIVWHVHHERYESQTRHRLIGGCIAAIYFEGYRGLLLHVETAWIGPLVALWLLIDAADLFLGKRRRPSEDGRREPVAQATGN